LLDSHVELVEVIGEASDGASGLQACREKRPDAVFLDIQMPPPNGLELAAELAEWEAPPWVVFLTAYSEHAVKAFEVRAQDYLVKPISRERLAQTVARLCELRKEPDDCADAASIALQKYVPAAEHIERIALLDEVTENRTVTPVTEIEYFFSRDEKCFAQKGEKEFLLSSTMARLEASLSPKDFFRTHRCYIVNVNRVRTVVPWFNGAYNLRMANNAEVPLTRRRVSDFRKLVDWS
jgi:DNA-binding LytR/AlgR family response regulator